ncbi:poly-beta-1,6-N-acetyl-D-glucosamine N-deacetylase PgaB [Eoetvoesiella caeni]
MLESLSRMRALLLGLYTLLLLGGCAANSVPFVPPDQRPFAANEQPWPQGSFAVLAYHDIEDRDPDQTYVAVRADNLQRQFAWLRENNYQPVSISQILAARDGGPALPPKAILLSFDDGYSSFYTRVFPMLKAYNWPALLAPVGTWVDTPADKPVDFAGVSTPRGRFLNVAQLRELSKSPLIEIGAHTYNLHYGVLANPQGNLQPAAATYIYDPKSGKHESRAAFERRITADVERVNRRFKEITGKTPRVWVWPYGAANGQTLQILKKHGYQMALTLEEGRLGNVNSLMNVPRLLVSEDPRLSEFANAVISVENRNPIRVAHVDLDYVYDPDPVQMDRNVGELVQRIADLNINTVFLQAFADPDGDGLVKSVYFPNRHLPMRADLFNRVAWQLMTRASSTASVQVFAWMPVLSFDLAPSIARVERWDPKTGAVGIDPKQYRRLSPFDPEARKQITEIYEDLARSSSFGGILYHDDALLSDFEDASPPALAAYRQAGLPDTPAALNADPAIAQRWMRFKSRYLIDFTKTLTQHVRNIRGPQIQTARNIYAPPLLEPQSEAWFAQNLDDFLSTYDWTVPMAMPLMEGVPRNRADAWLDKLVDAVAARPGALDKTVFEVQARDWNRQAGTADADADAGAIDSKLIAHWMNRLLLRGATSFGYYPDDFVKNQPRVDIIRPAISTSWYPFK